MADAGVVADFVAVGVEVAVAVVVVVVAAVAVPAVGSVATRLMLVTNLPSHSNALQFEPFS